MMRSSIKKKSRTRHNDHTKVQSYRFFEALLSIIPLSSQERTFNISDRKPTQTWGFKCDLWGMHQVVGIPAYPNKINRLKDESL